MTSVLTITPAAKLKYTVDEMISEIELVAPRLQANALAEEKAGYLSEETIQVLDEIGVFRISLPLEYDGLA